MELRASKKTKSRSTEAESLKAIVAANFTTTRRSFA
jgi:hypothetical protein